MKTLALLIDGDNAQLSTTKHLLQFCEVIGTLRIKKAYGDWEQPPLSSQCQTLIDLGVNLVQQNRVTKNATDFRLAMDVALMLDKGEADIYFIVSSDGHFTAVCEQIHQKGAKVIGIAGNGNASGELRKACDIFFDLEDIVKNPSQSPVNASTLPQSKGAPNPIPKIKDEPKTEPKISTIAETQVESSKKVATVPQLKTSAVLKFLNEPSAKVRAVSKAVPKPKVEAKPTSVPKLEPTAKVKVVSLPKAEPDPAAILKILINNYKKAPQKEGWVNLAQLKDVRPQLKQKFGLGFANKPISTWFKAFPDKFEIESDWVRMK